MQKSFISVSPDSHFPIQNLPYGVFIPPHSGEAHVGVAIGDYVLDLAVLESLGMLKSEYLPGYEVFRHNSLNAFMAAGRPAWRAVRHMLQHLLDAETPTLRDNTRLRDAVLFPRDRVRMLRPVEIGDYTDFYSSKEHAVNVGKIIRGEDKALNPNWQHLPIAYHGRASSVIVSGTNVHRPWGQVKPTDSDNPVFTASHAVDFELELGFLVGTGNVFGQPIRADNAIHHVFGMVLLNDWSARDIQRWEYQPLGPFLAKNFATTISPWVVTMDALEPFRCAGPAQDPQPLPYLLTSDHWNYDIQLEVQLETERYDVPVTISQTNYKYMYWNLCQQLAHHTINGCNMRSGDLCGSGTISGPTPDSYGSMLELTWNATRPISMPDGEMRGFLQDGDTVIMKGWCKGDGYTVGFGEARGTLLSALPLG